MTTNGPYAEMAATGTTQATAAEMTADKVMVTTVTASADGVILPARNLNDIVLVVNGQGTHNLKVYPRTGGKLNNATANVAIELPPYRSARFEGINSLNWMVFY